MSLAIIYDAIQTASQVLKRPPPLGSHGWSTYRVLTPLLTERHAAAINLLKNETGGTLSQLYESDVDQIFLNDVFMGGIRYVRLLDKDISNLTELTQTPDVQDYLLSLSMLRENLDGTIRYYFRLRGK